MTEPVFESYTAEDIHEMRRTNGIMVKRITHLTEEVIFLQNKVERLEELLKTTPPKGKAEIVVDNETKVA